MDTTGLPNSRLPKRRTAPSAAELSEAFDNRSRSAQTLRMSLFILGSGWVLFVLWVLGVTPSLISMLWRSLDSVAGRLQEPAIWPKVSIIVPARDEEAKIDSAMRSKLAIDYPDLEIIAVDDRSQDATGLLLDRLAAEDSRLSVVHLDSLADGWLGKSHAMHVAAARAMGDYLLFTDADVFCAGRDPKSRHDV